MGVIVPGINHWGSSIGAMTFPILQTEADSLIQLPKIPVSRKSEMYPSRGESLRMDFSSADRREAFQVTITRGRIDLAKVNHHLIGKQIVGLVRLDIGVSTKHRNPDDVWINGPHLHVYREGDELKWAVPLPSEGFDPGDDLLMHLQKFFAFCQIAPAPNVAHGLFL
jgi:hypothetical protein